jgi:hypothetical protein
LHVQSQLIHRKRNTHRSNEKAALDACPSGYLASRWHTVAPRHWEVSISLRLARARGRQVIVEKKDKIKGVIGILAGCVTILRRLGTLTSPATCRCEQARSAGIRQLRLIRPVVESACYMRAG